MSRRTARRTLWILIAALLIVGSAIYLTDGGPKECDWDEATHFPSGECVPCPVEATPESPCFALIGDEL